MVCHGGTLSWPTHNLQNCCGSLCQHNFSVLLSANTLLHRQKCWEWTSVVFKIIVDIPFQKATTTKQMLNPQKYLKVRVKVTSLLNQLDPLLLWLWGSHSWTLQIKAVYSWSLEMIRALYRWSLEMRKVGVWKHRHLKKCKMTAVGKRPSWSLSDPLAGWLALISTACCGCEPKAINLISLTGLTDKIESCSELSHWNFSCLWSSCDLITARLQYLHYKYNLQKGIVFMKGWHCVLAYILYICPFLCSREWWELLHA